MQITIELIKNCLNHSCHDIKKKLILQKSKRIYLCKKVFIQKKKYFWIISFLLFEFSAVALNRLEVLGTALAVVSISKFLISLLYSSLELLLQYFIAFSMNFMVYFISLKWYFLTLLPVMILVNNWKSYFFWLQHFFFFVCIWLKFQCCIFFPRTIMYDAVWHVN